MAKYRVMKRGDRRVKGYQLRVHGEQSWHGPSSYAGYLMGQRLKKQNLDYAEFRAPVKC